MNLDALLGRAEDLIAIPSTADRPEDLHRALDLVLDAVGPGFELRRFESRGKPSALLSDGRTPRVILNGHLDVVPGTPGQFVPRREGQRLYGRGAQDMKVAALVLAEVFRELAPVLPYPIALQLVCDEEVGGFDGTAHQIEQGVTGGFVVIGEQSGLRLVTESKGLLQVRLRTTGRAAHAAYPWLGENALTNLFRAVEKIETAFPTPAAEEWVTTVNLARITTTNAAVNQVPADATAWLDIRFPPEDGRSGAELAEHLRDLTGAEVIVDAVAPPHHADPECLEVKLLQKGELLRKHGAADGRFYSARGINAVIFGPGGDGQHGPAEYLDVTTVEPYYAALRAFLTSTAMAENPYP